MVNSLLKVHCRLRAPGPGLGPCLGSAQRLGRDPGMVRKIWKPGCHFRQIWSRTLEAVAMLALPGIPRVLTFSPTEGSGDSGLPLSPRGHSDAAKKCQALAACPVHSSQGILAWFYSPGNKSTQSNVPCPRSAGVLLPTFSHRETHPRC